MFSQAVWSHSGHYRPTQENFQEFISFLKENNVDLTDVKVIILIPQITQSPSKKINLNRLIAIA